MKKKKLKPNMLSLRKGMQQPNLHYLKTGTGCRACFAAKNSNNI
jgi:hypothetical protein